MKTLVAAAAGLALVLTAALTGCDSGNCEINYLNRRPRATRTVVVTKPTVAVLPFSCATAPNAGYVVADNMAAQLCDMGGCTVVTPQAVASKAATLNRVLTPEESGRLVGAPYVITGQVTEYVANAKQGDKPVVGVTAQVINTATGEVVWTKTSSRSGSAAWYQEDNVGVLTNQVVGDLAQGISAYEWKTTAPVATGRVVVAEGATLAAPTQASAPAQAARPLPAAKPMNEGTADLVEPVKEAVTELPAKAGLIDFPEVPNSPDNFGLVAEPEKVAESVETQEDGDPSAPIGEGSYQDMARRAPKPRQPASYTMDSAEVARILDMFEDPYTPSLEEKPVVPAPALAEKPKAMPEAKPAEEVAAGPMYVMPDAIELTVRIPEEKVVVAEAPAAPELPVGDPFESVESVEDMAAIDGPGLVMPSPIEITVPEAMEPAPQMANGGDLTPERELSAEAKPSEELVPVSLGFFLDDDESRQPLQAAHTMALDDDDFMPKAVDADDEGIFRLTIPAAASADMDDEDSLDFFGKMSQNIDLDFRLE